MIKVGDTYKITKNLFGWTAGETAEVVEMDHPQGYVDLSNGYHKICLHRGEVQKYISNGVLEQVTTLPKGTSEIAKCYTCNWKMQPGFRFDYYLCEKCGKTREF